MKRIMKTSLIAGAVMLALPLCAVAAENTTGMRQAQQQRDATITQEESDKATMDRLQRKEDKQSMGEYVDDAQVTAKVKSTFVGQKGLDSLDIKVVTVDGTVTLMGDVDNNAQVSLAEQVAKDVDGVRKIDNKLVVKQ